MATTMKTDAQKVADYRKQAMDKSLPQEVRDMADKKANEIEAKNAKKAGGQRSMKPGNADDPSSFKVRRGKVGGWRDYVTDAQADALEAMVRERLNPVYRYPI